MATKEEMLGYLDLRCEDEHGEPTIGRCNCCPIECKVLHDMLEE